MQSKFIDNLKVTPDLKCALRDFKLFDKRMEKFISIRINHKLYG